MKSFRAYKNKILPFLAKKAVKEDIPEQTYVPFVSEVEEFNYMYNKMSQQNKSTLQSAINTDLADNTSGDISAADVRDNLINMTDSLLFNSGSQGITGSLIVSGSANSVFDIDLFDLQITGGLDVSRDVAVRDDLTVYDDTNLRKDVNIGFRDDNPGFGYSLAVTQSINTSGSAKFIGGITMETLPTTEPNLTGSLWISGSSLSHPNSGYLMIFNP
jgi:hypothetical protein